MKINFVDLKNEYESLKEDIDKSIREVIGSSSFIGGKEVENFEEAFTRYLGVKYTISVNSGTDALILALRSLGIGKGDEVIVPTFSFVATAFSVSLNGATPIFLDVESDSHTIDADLIESKINSRTKAIIPVHMYGNPCNMNKIMQIAKKNKLFVIEDAAQAHGAEYNGKKIGTIGDIGCFSFYPSKNLGAYGDGGAMVTNNKEIAEKLKLQRNYGQSKKYHSDLIGINSRLDAIQAAVLSVKLKRLDEWSVVRRGVASRYRKNLNLEKGSIFDEKYGQCVYHLFPIQVENRDELINHLSRNGVTSLIHYPVPIHRQKAYKNHMQHKESLRFSGDICRTTLSLPMHPFLSTHQIDYIVKTVNTYLDNN